MLSPECHDNGEERALVCHKVTVVGKRGMIQGGAEQPGEGCSFSQLGQAPADSGASLLWMLAGTSCLLLEGSVGDAVL